MHGILGLFRGSPGPGSALGETTGDASQDETSYGPLILSPGSATNQGVDIIFVHGLRGSRLGTWSQGDFCWPRELLAKEDGFETSRVIAWGYDSRVAEPTAYVTFELESLGPSFSSPIALGGLVVKEALIMAASYHSNGRFPDQAELYKSTRGVVFYGTPHRGSGKTALGGMVANFAQFSLLQPNTQLFNALRRDSHVLEKQRDEFATISRDMDVLCFAETKPTAIGMIVPPESAVYDGFRVQSASADGNHMEMVKITEHHARLKTLLEALKYDTVKPSDRTTDTNTCNWILKTPADYDSNGGHLPTIPSWLESHDGRIFWISGKAGCGKSTLMQHMSHILNMTSTLSLASVKKPPLVVYHSFYELGKPLQMTQEGLLRSSLSDMLRLALEAFQEASIPLIFLIDGLDEYRMPPCPSDGVDNDDEYDSDGALDTNDDDDKFSSERHERVTKGHREVAEFVQTLAERPGVRVCIASREMTIFKVHLHTMEDIKRVCRSRLEDPILQPLAEEIVKRANGIFLWVRLVLDSLITRWIDGTSYNELHRTVERMPPRLGGRNGLFMRMLHPSGGSNITHVFLVARGQNATNRSDAATDRDLLDTTRHKALLASRCGGLLETRPEKPTGTIIWEYDHIAVVHLTVADFLTRGYVARYLNKHCGDISTFDPYLALVDGAIRYIQLQPDIVQQWMRDGFAATAPLHVMMYAAFADMKGSDLDQHVALVDRFDQVLTKVPLMIPYLKFMSQDERLENAELWTSKGYPGPETRDEVPRLRIPTHYLWPPVRSFLDYATVCGLARYVDQRLRLLRPDHRKSEASRLLDLLLEPFYDAYRGVYCTFCDHRTARMLLSHGTAPSSRSWWILLETGYHTGSAESSDYRLRHLGPAPPPPYGRNAEARSPISSLDDLGPRLLLWDDPAESRAEIGRVVGRSHMWFQAWSAAFGVPSHLPPLTMDSWLDLVRGFVDNSSVDILVETWDFAEWDDEAGSFCVHERPIKAAEMINLCLQREFGATEGQAEWAQLMAEYGVKFVYERQPNDT
ncbi:hypothetical protein PG997_011547 [Apiospora hydei]|uniref:NACHT domain-containing protein n=1 Tax=Apiospora hydei TaxID=1337664 RepID=A0ABR1VN53_9PEZI